MHDVKPQMIRTATTYSLRFGVCLLGLCLTVTGARLQAQAQEPAQVLDSSTSSKAADNTLSITGNVVNALTGEPVRGAVVSILTGPIGRVVGQSNGQTGSSTLSDNSGRFQFDGLAEGRAFISAMKPGFGNPFRGQMEQTSVQVTRNLSPVLLKMDPSGAIFGRLTGSDEQPLEGFFLHVIAKQQRMGGKRQWAPFPSQATTDDNGNFRIAGLPADTYYLQVTQSQETTLSRRGVPNPREQSYAEVFYPGVADFSSATPIEVTGGREVEANFSIAAEPLYEVSGVVSTQDLNSPIVFSRKAGADYDFVQNAMAQDGRFQIKLPAGSFSVTGSTTTGTQLIASSVVVSSDNPNLNIALSLAPSIRVELQTQSSSGSTQQNSPEQLGSLGISLQLMRTAGLPGPSYWWGPGQSEGFQGVVSGVYTVQANGPIGTWYIKSLRSGSIDLVTDDLTVVEGAQPQPIEVILRDDAASVRGTVTPADDMVPAIVLLIQPRGTKNLIKATGAFQGKFGIDGVAPGDYLLLAFDGMDRLDYENPEVLNPYLSRAEHVGLQPHAIANVNLSLSPTGR